MDKQIAMDLKFKIDSVDMEVSVENLILNNTENDDTIRNLHYHVMYELFFTEDIPLILYTDGERTTFKNCIVCIPPYTRHRVLSWRGKHMMFSFKNTAKNSGDFARFMDKFFRMDEPFEIKTDDTLNMYADRLLEMFDKDMTSGNEFMIAAVKLIFYSIYVNNENNRKSNAFLKENYIVKIENMINRFKSDINLKSVAAELNLSTKQTSRIIRKNYGKSLSSMLREKRLSVAAELLASKNMTILEIVEYVNFPSESYFYSEFKKAYGCTPMKYRKDSRNITR